MRLPAVRDARDGLSLLEVIAALAIFLISLVAIGRLLDISNDLALDVRWRGEGQLHCQSKLAELASGAASLQGGGESSVEGDEDWNCAVDAQSDGTPGLYRVTVTASRQKFDGTKYSVSMSRWLLDPAVRGSTDPNTLGTDDPTATSGTTTAGTTAGTTSPTTTTTAGGGTKP